MNKIKDILHEKRKTTEDHIRQLQQVGKQGIRYTAMMPDIPFLVLGLLSDIGWIMHLTAGIIYFCRNGFYHVLDYFALAALAAVMFGVAYIIYLNKIHEKEIATKRQKGSRFWHDCVFRSGRCCYRNIPNRDVCRCFTGACVDSDRRIAEFRRGTADLPLV